MAVSQRETECLETGDVTGQFEDSENPQNSEYLGDFGNILETVGVSNNVEDLGEVEGDDSDEINNVEERHDKLALKPVVH